MTVYNMPIWLRKLTFNKLKEWFDAEAEANAQARQKYSNTGKGNTTNIDLNNPNKSAIPEGPKVSVPSYVANMRKGK